MNKTRSTGTLQQDSTIVDIVGWIFIVTSVMVFLTLASYNPADPSFFHQANQGSTVNLLGRTGANLSAFFYHFFGFASFAVPCSLLFAGVQSVRRKVNYNWLFGLTGGLAILICLMSFAGSFGPFQYRGYPVAPGGLFGKVLWGLLYDKLSSVGSYLTILLFLGLALLITTRLQIMHVAGWVAKVFSWITNRSVALFDGLAQRVRERRKVMEHHRILVKEQEKYSRDFPQVEEPPEPKPKKKKMRKKKAKPEPEPEEMTATLTESEEQIQILEGEALFRETGPVQAEMPFEVQKPKWKFPNVDFFEAPHEHNQIDREELHHRASALSAKLKEFDVTGKMQNIIPGPIVTTYEFRPDPGIKYSKIVGLQDDLCLALGAESMRVDRIPGRYSIGFEVPNLKKETIYFREMVTHETFQEASSKLMLTLGKTIEGEPYCSDLSKMPHLLIAGQTGSGKSVGLNAMICSILMNATPEEVQFILIDPKMVEMSSYNDIPHLITPVVTDCLEASAALKWAVVEMENRYKQMARYMVRGIDQFNREFSLGNITAEEGDEINLIPRIVVVIDELADLMMVARGEVEESIARLAQKSRAVGIHLILATQRPSTDILTGLIKSNLPCRLSYRVAQRNDSRIILDSNGADQLLGKGDALFLPPGSGRLIRIHAPWLSTREINTLTGFLRKQAKPDYDTSILSVDDADGGMSEASGIGGMEDAMYEKAARLVVSSGQASVSYLQRKLSVGYARAAKLIDMMEHDGIVGPHRGSKARDILVPADYYNAVDDQLK